MGGTNKVDVRGPPNVIADEVVDEDGEKFSVATAETAVRVHSVTSKELLYFRYCFVHPDHHPRQERISTSKLKGAAHTQSRAAKKK